MTFDGRAFRSEFAEEVHGVGMRGDRHVRPEGEAEDEDALSGEVAKQLFDAVDGVGGHCIVHFAAARGE